MLGCLALACLANCSAVRRVLGQPSPVPPTPILVTSPQPSPSPEASVDPMVLPGVAGTSPPPLAPCCPVDPSGPVAIAFTGLAPDQQLGNAGHSVSFSVQFTNPTTRSFPSVAPVVAAEAYPGAPGSAAQDSLQRFNPANGSWKAIRLSEDGAGKYLTSGDDGAFPLPAGASENVVYRMALTGADPAGPLQIDALAVALPTHTSLGQVTLQISVRVG